MEGCHGASFNGGLDHRPNTLRATRSFDTELSIFDAERYFSEGSVAPHRAAMLDLAAERCVLSTNLGDALISSVDGCGQSGRCGSHQSTPNASSKGSWNSKSCLLSQPPDSVGVAVRALPPKDTRKFGTLRLFDGSCLCSSKKSVEVEATVVGTTRPIHSHMDSNTSVREGKVELSRLREGAAAEKLTSKFDVEEVTKVKLTPGNWGEDRTCFSVTHRFPPEKTFPAGIGRPVVNSRRPFMESFSFPVLNPPSSNLDEEAARHSLEIFRHKETASVVKKSVDIHRGTAVLENPRERSYPSFIYPAIPKSRPEDDAASDASSDLFEIESLSTLITCRRREVLDDIGGMRFAGIISPRLSLEGSEDPPSAAPSVAIMDLRTNAASNHEESRFGEAESEQLAASMGGALISRSRDEKAVSFVLVPPSQSNSPPRKAKLANVNLEQERAESPV